MCSRLMFNRLTLARCPRSRRFDLRRALARRPRGNDRTNRRTNDLRNRDRPPRCRGRAFSRSAAHRGRVADLARGADLTGAIAIRSRRSSPREAPLFGWCSPSSATRRSKPPSVTPISRLGRAPGSCTCYRRLRHRRLRRRRRSGAQAGAQRARSLGDVKRPYVWAPIGPQSLPRLGGRFRYAA